MVGDYFDAHPGSIPSKKQHLAAIRQFFDVLVQRHVVILNPALSVHLERYQVIEGKTPEITVEQARRLLNSIDTSTVVGLRDRAAIALLIYTAARVGAVAKLRLGDVQHDGSQYLLRFSEKGGKSREIPVRHDLERFIQEYIDAAAIREEPKESPLLRSAAGKEKRLTARPMTGIFLGAMLKRRLKDVGLPARLSPHSFRVATITDLLTQGVPLEDVQYLAGHADPRTTRLYDRRQKRVTRNIVERISI
jgi:site-specific recombinase XerD